MRAMIRGFLQLLLARIVAGSVDEEMRVKWLRGPVGRQLTELAGPMDEPMPAAQADAGSGAGAEATAATAATAQTASPTPGLDDVDRQLLHLLTQGSTNREMANELKLDEAAVSQRLARLLANIGASSRAQATSFAFRGIGM